MGGLFLLIVLCVVMALASFLAGALPLSMALSQTQLRFLSSIGIGVLVGTSLIIIIPEGIEAAASAATSEASHNHRMRRVARRSPWGIDVEPTYLNTRDVPVVRVSRPKFYDEELDAAAAAEEESDVVPMSHIVVQSTSDKREEEEQSPEEEAEPEHGHEHEHDEDEHDDDHDHEDDDDDHDHAAIPTLEIGMSLILGFVLMFLIDRLPKHATERFQPAPQMQHVSLDNLGARDGDVVGLRSDTASIDGEEEGFLGSMAPSPRRARSLATTLGLVIHATADGIAMGASSTTSDTQLGFIIFLAIMIHKAPAAFGLTSVLLKQGLSKRAARGHLIVFSLAAPVGALATWLLITILGGGSMDGNNGKYWTGMLLLFSGGTFLYVAMHAMNEDAGHDHSHSHGANGFTDGSSSSHLRKQQGPQMRDTLATMAGMLLPLLTQLGGHHHH